MEFWFWGDRWARERGTPPPCKEQKSAQVIENKQPLFGAVQKSEDLRALKRVFKEHCHAQAHP
jgi:hypothetical protein